MYMGMSCCEGLIYRRSEISRHEFEKKVSNKKRIGLELFFLYLPGL